MIRLSAGSILAGILIGLVGGAFRYLLIVLDHWRDELIRWAHFWPYVGWLAPVALGLGGAAVARAIVIRFAPLAEGSGIQHVEAVFSGEAEEAPLTIVPIKFFGGLLALGSGLALGREGPTVQMGAALGWLISHRLINDDQDKKVIGAAGAGAGLAVAFNAPLGGSIFVFEELTGRITPWLLVATLAAALVGVWTMRMMLGNGLDYEVRQVSFIEAWRIGPFLALGALLGAVGALIQRHRRGPASFRGPLGPISPPLVDEPRSHHRCDGGTHRLVCSGCGWGRQHADTDRTRQPLCNRGPADGLSGALSPWPVVVCRRRARGTLCTAFSTWRFFGRAFRRNPESFRSAAGFLAHRLCGGRDGGNVFGQRARAPDRNCAYH